MSGGWRRWGFSLALFTGLESPALAQFLAPPPLPAVPEPVISPELEGCVRRFGHTGCAARLYAQLLCASLGTAEGELERMEAKLAEQYDQAAIDFRGITPEQVETAAVRYYAPMLCPEKSPKIRQLFAPS
ncbi:MAG: hypothetical protein KXJ49_04895 [Vulcanococcus sp.]|nr:hypothetical protein [Vulcanococcus sp.]